MYNKTITFTFDSEKTYKSFLTHFFGGIDDALIEAMECKGGIVDLTDSRITNSNDSDNIIIALSFRKEN